MVVVVVVVEGVLMSAMVLQQCSLTLSLAHT